jgi:hypothetical protein
MALRRRVGLNGIFAVFCKNTGASLFFTMVELSTVFANTRTSTTQWRLSSLITIFTALLAVSTPSTGSIRLTCIDVVVP